MKKLRGTSGLSLLVALAILCFILFYLGPKYLKPTSSPVQSSETLSPGESQKSILYVDSYRKGMAGAKAAVDASKERNKGFN